ncbi:MAG: D-cysteine desulfhydrase family protein [Deltaproteobacteria bacterium]|nr:D-cysteine desulfhydrase family protein [Deltaproteobacteria bacterium]
MSNLEYPSSVELAHLPTPLTPLERLSARLGAEVLCKRDDLTGAPLSGNKVRKLEFLMADALDRSSPGVVTCGGEQSNHARATAIAAARLGLKSHLLLRTADPKNPPALEGNILLDRLVGASIRWISREQWKERDALMASDAQGLAASWGGAPYVIPEGGSDAVGAWGYVRCVAELAEQLGAVPATIVYATGSGGTGAGLIAGCRLLDLPYRLVGVCVCDGRAYFQRRITEILAQMSARYGVDVTTDAEGIEIWENYVGRGYALSREEELRCLIDAARLEGLLLDPVYTGKAFYGLLTELKNGRALGGPVVFLHTGGIYGLFPKAAELAPLL